MRFPLLIELIVIATSVVPLLIGLYALKQFGPRRGPSDPDGGPPPPKLDPPAPPLPPAPRKRPLRIDAPRSKRGPVRSRPRRARRLPQRVR